ncbi:MAG: hypothetical protein K6T91_08090 [Firmicutes bacterium]|nr:hypothetical protein [Bacillota bacterium]
MAVLHCRYCKLSLDELIRRKEKSSNWAHYKVKDEDKIYDLYDELDHGAGHSTTNRIGDKVKFTYHNNVLGFMKRVDE